MPECSHQEQKWDKSGKIIEVKKHRQYLMRMTGSGRVSLRNRRHIQRIVPPVLSTQQHQQIAEKDSSNTEEAEHLQDNSTSRDSCRVWKPCYTE